MHLDIPLIWTAHDKNVFTGACHCLQNCEKWQRDCKNCPQLKNTYDDFPAKILKFKKQYWNTENMTIVALNPNLVQTYQKSPVLKNARIEIIYNSIDTAFFTPVSEEEKKNIRAELKLPQDKTILMYSSAYNARIKGYKECIEALSLLKNKHNFHLIVVGDAGSTQNIPISYTNFGYVSENDMQQFYCVADITILSSLEETLPNVMLESLACGTPLVAFTGVGGCEHFINNELTGYTVPLGEVSELAQAIEKISQLSPDKYYAMSKACRDCALKHFTPEIQAQKYNKLYKSVITEKRKKAQTPYKINTSIPQFNPETSHHVIDILTDIVQTTTNNRWYLFGKLSKLEKIIALLILCMQKLRLYRLIKTIFPIQKKSNLHRFLS